MKPVLCKVRGYAVAGGSDIALCADMSIMAETAEIGYIPARVWGRPTTAMWVYRLDADKAIRILFTGYRVKGRESKAMGLILKAVPDERLDQEVEDMDACMMTIPANQLAMQKWLLIRQSRQAV